MLVDNSVVVIENIYRHLSMGKNSKQTASEGTKKLLRRLLHHLNNSGSIFTSRFVSGLVGQLFTPLAITVVFSICIALYPLTVVPMLAVEYLRSLKMI